MLALVTCHFNPCGYTQNVENYYRFRKALNRPMTVVELSFDGSYLESDSIRIRGDINKHCMWQKERLLNIGIESLPDKYDKVAWIDADIQFFRPDWFEEAEKALQHHDVVQLVGKLHHTDANGGIVKSVETEGWKMQHDPSSNKYYHPGGCWAARREVISRGLYDKDIIGGGDSALFYAWSGTPENKYAEFEEIPELKKDYVHWAAKQKILDIGYVPGDGAHFWHGAESNRRYLERYMSLQLGDFDPENDIFINADGIWEWATEKPLLHNSLQRYFIGRNEDGSQPRNIWAGNRLPNEANLEAHVIIDARKNVVPKISVVVPVFNCVKYIGESLESIRNQTFKDYELIIVHDGSTDDTLTIMCSHLERLGFENLLLINQLNGGTGAALNEGFRHVRGEYSTWWTADSFMEEICLENLLTTIESSDVDFVYGDYSILYEESGVTQLVQVPEFDYQRLQNDCFVGVCWLWKHSLKQLSGEFQTTVCEDYDMHLRMAEIGTFRRCPGHLGTWRNHSENVSNRICIPRDNVQGRHVSWHHAWRKAEKKIAYICAKDDAAGVGWFHAEGIYESPSTTAARHVVGHSTHLMQLEDLKIGIDDAAIRKTLDECDLIHLNLLLPDDRLSLLDVTPWLDKGKPVIFHMHGGHWPWDRQKINLFQKTYNATLVSCTPGIEKLYSSARWMPNYLPISESLSLREAVYFHPRADWQSLPTLPSVGFYHNYSPGKGGDLIHLMQLWIEKELELGGLFNLEYRDSSPIPLREHLTQKKKHDVTIDNITQGFIGMAGWEAMAQGQVLLSRLDEYALREYTKLGDGQPPPIVNVAWWDELAVYLIEMGKDPDAIVDLKRRTRAWMLEHYNAERIIQLWDRLYSEVLNGVS